MRKNEIITTTIVILAHIIIIVVDHFVISKHAFYLYI